MAEPETAPVETTPAGGGSHARRAANAFIALFLAYQVAMPLSYYLTDRVYDERFGWRMFSTLRLQQCALSVTEAAEKGGATRPVALGETLHVAWVNLLKRGWPRVIEKYLGERCAADKVAEVRLERRCRATDGSELAPEHFALTCGTDTLRTGMAAE